ncbi:rod shape-determining protein MreC [Planococcus sp. CP5-4]|uniref:rod shape-determining protein MreC n=1 Tax=unclassified Planococcus (in: firmicutes) TaxID=2662419 RepID=UPI001C226050|nr:MULTISPECIES: rod shape-determining protein MreC [unclassified Planococcus (in: firmicutes)]MBU9672891.1 rod shape-determining protein MreC [Planococcus sp. CP5-4_YE]MBV0908663.1 rod shape-determining protein MreC [Planococcus sp. CP5-4_UN]MBW6063432.1 rod shape-determining protein MreC [Planococcus sp. CP5-4]MDE4083806.1 rod shape-determining protein MreC [Planococcus maritimus]
MPQFLSNKRLILLLIGVILLVALISLTLRDRGQVSLPEQIVKEAVGAGQSVFSRPAHFVTGVFDNIDSLINTFEENRLLKARLEEFAGVQAEVTDLRSENEELKELVGKEEDLREYNPIQAVVIARNPDQWEEKIILNRGTNHGVKENMAVMTAGGLIGKVTIVTPTTSTVELVTTQNPNYRVSAMVLGEDDVFGLIEGYDAERRELLLKRIDFSVDLKEGDQVVSSGLGGIFPKGIVIGEITEVTIDEFGLTKLAYVKPAADFSMLNHVVIADRLAPEVDGEDNGMTEDEEEES